MRDNTRKGGSIIKYNNNETIDWNALIDEYKSDHIKKVIELKSISMNKNSFIQLEYNGFRLKLFPGFDEELLRSVIRCLSYDS